MAIISIGPFSGFFGRGRANSSSSLSSKQQAAKRVYDIAKNAGNAISALEVAKKYDLDESVVELGRLLEAVRLKCTDERAKGRHVLALVYPWCNVSGPAVGSSLVEEALQYDPSLLPQAASVRGISSEFRASLIRRMLTEGIATPDDVVTSFARLMVKERIPLAQSCIEYALEKNNIVRAYGIANLFPAPVARECVSASLRTRMVELLLALPAVTIKEHNEHQDWAIQIA